MEVDELSLHGINSVSYWKLISRNRLSNRLNLFLKITITDLWPKPFCIQISCFGNVISTEHSSLRLPCRVSSIASEAAVTIKWVNGQSQADKYFHISNCGHQGQIAHSTLAHTKEVKVTFCAGGDVNYGILRFLWLIPKMFIY